MFSCKFYYKSLTIASIVIDLLVSIFIIHKYFIYDPIHGTAYLYILYKEHIFWADFPYKAGPLPFLGMAILGKILNIIYADWIFYHSSGFLVLLITMCMIKLKNDRKYLFPIAFLLLPALNHYFLFLFGGKSNFIAITYLILILYLFKKIYYNNATNKEILLLIIMISLVTFSYPLYLIFILHILILSILLFMNKYIILKSSVIKYAFYCLFTLAGLYFIIYPLSFTGKIIENILSKRIAQSGLQIENILNKHIVQSNYKHIVQSNSLTYIKYWIFESELSPYIIYRFLYMIILLLIFTKVIYKLFLHKKAGLFISLVMIFPFYLSGLFLKPVPMLHAAYTIIGVLLTVKFSDLFLNLNNRNKFILFLLVSTIITFNILTSTKVAKLYSPRITDYLKSSQQKIIYQMFNRIKSTNEVITSRAYLFIYKLALSNYQIAYKVKFSLKELWWTNPEIAFNWLINKLHTCKCCILIYDPSIEYGLKVISHVRPKYYELLTRILFKGYHNIYLDTSFLKIYGWTYCK